VLSREQLIEEISLERIGAADAMFDPARLSWLSSKHIERMPLDALVNAVRPFVDHTRFSLNDAELTSAVAATRTHYATFADVNEQLAMFFPLDSGAVSDGPAIHAAATVLGRISDWNEDALREAIREIAAASGLRGRALYEPLRRALTGRDHGPPLPAVLFVQGRERVLAALPATVDSDHGANP
jgi:glutamyl-tRNA synthetase